MLKSNYEKISNSLIINSLIDLGDDIAVEGKGKGRKFVSRFIEPGVAHYEEFGDVLITKETLNKFINTMIGCPVIIKHKDIDDKNVDKERVGVISNVWFNELDGWFYCDGIIWDKQAIDLVKNQGWNVSCTYDFESDKQKKTHNGKKIDMEFTGGEFLHLALVPNPRYERANIVMNAKDEKKEKQQDSIKDVVFDAIAEVVTNCLGESRANNKNDEPKDWITIKGNRIPIEDGETKSEAAKEFVKEKQENNKNNKVSQEDEPNYIAEKYKNYKEFETTYKNYIDAEPENYKYNTVEETLEDLGIKENQPLVIKTPLGKENITIDSIDHIVKGGGTNHPPDKTRFKSINKMIETLKKPLLIIEKSNNHRYYFKIFKSKDNESKNDMVVISPKDEVYTNFPIDRGTWFFKQIKTGKIKYDVLNH